MGSWNHMCIGNGAHSFGHGGFVSPVSDSALWDGMDNADCY